MGGLSDPENGIEDLTGDNEFIIIEGGRGGGKSESIAETFINISRVEETRILCTREIQNTMADSVYAMLEAWINKMDIMNEFHLTKNSIINKYTQTDFIFWGMKQAALMTDNLKGLKDCKYVWYEEAQTASIQSLKKLTPTIRKEDRKIIFSMNRNDNKDAVLEYFKDKKKVMRVYINYKDNIYCPQVLINEAEECKELNYPEYCHIWLGHPRQDSNDLVVLPKQMLKKCIDLHKRFKYEPGLKEGGFDIADGMTDKHDKNALVIRSGPLITNINQWQLPEVHMSINRIDNQYMEYGFGRLNFDATSLGIAAKSEFDRKNKQSKLKYSVVPILAGSGVMGKDKIFIRHGNHKITNGMKFKNLKAQLWWNLRLRLENSMRLIKGLPIDRPEYYFSISSEIEDLDGYINELSQATYSEDDAGRIKIDKAPCEKEIIEDGKKKKVRSPNRGDGTTLAYASDIKRGLIAHQPGIKKAKVI